MSIHIIIYMRERHAMHVCMSPKYVYCRTTSILHTPRRTPFRPLSRIPPALLYFSFLAMSLTLLFVSRPLYLRQIAQAGKGILRERRDSIVFKFESPVQKNIMPSH